MSSFLHSINSDNNVKAAQLIIMEAAQEVAAEVSQAVQQAVPQEWFHDVLKSLKAIVRTAAVTGSRCRQQQLCQG